MESFKEYMEANGLDGSFGTGSFQLLDDSNASISERAFLRGSNMKFEPEWDGSTAGNEVPIGAGDKIFFFGAGQKIRCLEEATWYGDEGVLVSSNGPSLVALDEVFLVPKEDFDAEAEVTSMGMDADDAVGLGEGSEDCDYICSLVISG